VILTAQVTPVKSTAALAMVWDSAALVNPARPETPVGPAGMAVCLRASLRALRICLSETTGVWPPLSIIPQAMGSQS